MEQLAEPQNNTKTTNNDIYQRVNKRLIGFVRYIFKRGSASFVIVFGRRETGKTDFMFLLAEILYLTGVVKYVATNGHVLNSPFPIERITDLDTLRFWAKTNKGPKLFLFDEYGKAMRRRSPMSSLNNQLIDDLQTLRKYKMTTIAATIDEKYVDNAALGDDVLDGVFMKYQSYNPKVALYNDLLQHFKREITNIPATSIKFDQWDVAPFRQHPINNKPVFKEKDLEVLWDISHGKTAEQLGLHTQQLTRIWKKFVKETLEKEHHTSQVEGIEDNV